MGFRELQKFNDAMLVKQVWHLLTNEDSLFHRFFKAKFFPKGINLEVKEGNGSFAWKSILKGRKVVQKRHVMESWQWLLNSDLPR